MKMYKLNGKNYTLKQLSKMYNVTYANLYGRLNRNWTLEEALGIKERKSTKTSKVYRIDGGEYTLKEISQMYGIKYKTLYGRLKSGWSLREAIGR